MYGRWMLFVALCYALTGSAQDADRKGSLYFFWGWNRSGYTDADIHFTGEGYDFVLHEVRATDRPSPVTYEYLHPLKLTVPQTNTRLGWFFNEHYSLALGFDHMKYVLVQDQVVRMDGWIGDADQQFTRHYDNEETKLSRDFLTLEHSDGLNFIHLQLARHSSLARVQALRLVADATAGIAVGMLMPRTACRFQGKQLSDDYHVSGYGSALKAGLWLTFFDHTVIAAELGGGYINMPDVRTSGDKADRASQRFWFTQGSVLVGAVFRLSKPEHNNVK